MELPRLDLGWLRLSGAMASVIEWRAGRDTEATLHNIHYTSFGPGRQRREQARSNRVDPPMAQPAEGFFATRSIRADMPLWAFPSSIEAS